jgi:hypothetical protein
VASTGDEVGDLVDVGHAQPHGADATAHGGQQVGVARRAEDPDGARRRLLERLQQHVARQLGHAVGVFDHHDAVAADRRREIARGDEVLHVLAQDRDALGAEHAEIGMRARLDLGLRRLLVAGARDEGGGERVGEHRAARSRRAGEQPRVRQPVAGRGGPERRDGLGLPRQVVPAHTHSVGGTAPTAG